MRLLGTLLLAPLAFVGQAAGAPGDLCAVEGHVVNSVTGAPVNKADLWLSLLSGELVDTESNAAGNFVFRNLTPGKYRLSAGRVGYQDTIYGADGQSVISLERGQKLTGIVFRVTPEGAVAGRVLDEDGDPLAYTQVRLCRFQYERGRKQLAPVGSATTNDLGEYRLFGVAPGKYLVSAYYSQERARSARITGSATVDPIAGFHDPRVDRDYPLTFYPGAFDPGEAASIEVAPGAQLRGIDFRLSKGRGVSVRGRVANSAPSDRQSPTLVTMMRRNGLGIDSPNRTAGADEQGNFEFANVVPGSYVLVASAVEGVKLACSAHQFLEVGTSNIEGVALSIAQPVELRGRMRAEGENAPAFGGLHVYLSSRDGDIPYGGATATVNDDGAFVLNDVNPERYDVTVPGLPDGYYLKAVRAGDADVLDAGLDITAGTPWPIEIPISPRAGVVTGVVRNQKADEPAFRAAVALIPREKARRERDTFYRTAISDQYGRFTLANIAPGEYKVFAWEQIGAGDSYMDPDFIQPVEDKGQAVTIHEGDKLDIKLSAIPR